MIIFFKSHIDQYTRQDGSVVQAHDDNRTAAPPPHPAAQKLSGAKREQYMAAHQQHHEITTHHMPNAQRQMDAHKHDYTVAREEHSKHHALANQAAENGDNDGAVKHGRIAYEASLRSFAATAKHRDAQKEYDNHAKKAETLHQKKEKLAPSA